jgi:hypothetical protein
MGSAHVAVAEDVTSVYWNPAGLSRLETLQVCGMHAERFGGVINWDFIGAGIPVSEKEAVGAGFFRLGVDDIPMTRLLDPGRDLGEVYIDENGQKRINTPYVEEWINDHEMAMFFSFSRRHSERFSFGANIKLLTKQVGDYSAWGIGFDVGFMFNIYQGLQWGTVLLDGTTTLLAWDGGRRELIAPHLKTGFAYPFQWNRVTLMTAMDFHFTAEDYGSAVQMHLGRFGLDIQTGIEADYARRVAIRAGLDRGRFTAGAGCRFSIFTIDYGFSHHNDLGNTHRVSMTLSWNRQRLLRL